MNTGGDTTINIVRGEWKGERGQEEIDYYASLSDEELKKIGRTRDGGFIPDNMGDEVRDETVQERIKRETKEDMIQGLALLCHDSPDGPMSEKYCKFPDVKKDYERRNPRENTCKQWGYYSQKE